MNNHYYILPDCSCVDNMKDAKRRLGIEKVRVTVKHKPEKDQRIALRYLPDEYESEVRLNGIGIDDSLPHFFAFFTTHSLSLIVMQNSRKNEGKTISYEKNK